MKSFYHQLLYKRLRLCKPELGELEDRRDPNFPAPALMEAIFADDAFEELVIGAQGLPRDFIFAFNDAASEISDDVSKRKITASNVRERYRIRSLQGALPKVAGAGTHGEIFLFQCVKPAVMESGSELFLVPNELRTVKVGEALDELARKRLIADYPSHALPSDVREKYRGYVLSYGVYVDWARSIQYGQATQSAKSPRSKRKHFVPSLSDSEDVLSYCVKADWLSDRFND